MGCVLRVRLLCGQIGLNGLRWMNGSVVRIPTFDYYTRSDDGRGNLHTRWYVHQQKQQQHDRSFAKVLSLRAAWRTGETEKSRLDLCHVFYVTRFFYLLLACLLCYAFSQFLTGGILDNTNQSIHK